MADRRAERRWIILGQDGRHVSIGRSSDPSEQEIAGAAAALVATGNAGWLAVLEGDYWAARGPVRLVQVRPLNGGTGGWDDAVVAFNRRRAEAIASS